jgi:pimeloyl-ACP methyl ester carboxylesterase
MDTEAARNASNDLEGGADQIVGLAQRLDGLLMDLEWTGPDAERTRASWQDQERRQLDLTAEHLRGLVTLIRQEADAQDHTSGDGRAAAAAPIGSSAVEQEPDDGLAGWLGGHLGAFFQGVGRTLDGAGDLAGKIGDVLTGEREWSVAAIAASALTTVGSAAGAVVNGVTGEDQGWFKEGPGLAGTPAAVPTDPTQATQFQPALTQPTDLPSLMQGVSDGYQVGAAPGSTGDVRITRVDNGGTPAYVVAIPGTENWSPAAGGQPRDLTANLALVAGNPAAAAQSVEAALQAAHIPPGAPVLLVGHSQGGIIAAQLAADPAFVERYGVTNVLTYGAPIDHVAVTPGVGVLQVQHGADVVPRLDLGGLGTSHPQTSTVTLASPGDVWRPDVNHSYTEYAQSVRDALGSDTDAGRILREYQSTLAPFLVGPGGSASAVDVPVSRGD